MDDPSISSRRFKDRIFFINIIRADIFKKPSRKSISTKRRSLRNAFLLLDSLSAFKNKNKDLLKILLNFYS